VLNANDALNSATATTRPENKYYYRQRIGLAGSRTSQNDARG
jgi:hypothetical protein